MIMGGAKVAVVVKAKRGLMKLAGLLMECLCDVGEHCVTNDVKAFSLSNWKEMMLLP